MMSKEKNGEIKIHITREYERFKKMPGNRPVDQAHVRRLMQSMRQQDLFTPIQCNERMEVVDGQHRLEARRQLNIHVPYYVVKGDYGLREVQKINAQQKKWGALDYLESNLELGNPETLPEALPKTGQVVGLDMGIENFATLSDGTQIDNWKYYESAQKELRRAQRSVSRKKKGSANRRKAVLRLRKIHQKIKNRRNDFQHKISTWLVKEFDVIAIEKLNILGMSRGILSKQIHDASWSSFFSMLRFKAENAGRKLIEINPAYTSQTCLCGHREKKSLSQRQHNCLKCGYKNHRDIVSAEIILSLGLSELAQTKAVGL